MVKKKKKKKSVLVTLRIYATWNAQVVSMVTYIPRMTAPNCGLRYGGKSGGGGGSFMPISGAATKEQLRIS